MKVLQGIIDLVPADKKLLIKCIFSLGNSTELNGENKVIFAGKTDIGGTAENCTFAGKTDIGGTAENCTFAGETDMGGVLLQVVLSQVQPGSGRTPPLPNVLSQVQPGSGRTPPLPVVKTEMVNLWSGAVMS